MTTYQVFCKGTARRWLPYSREFKTLEEAQNCMRRAEGLGNYSITGAPIVTCTAFAPNAGACGYSSAFCPIRLYLPF